MIRYYRIHLISLFSDLNQLSADPSNLSLCFSIQEELLTYIRRIEYRIRAIKDHTKHLRNTIKHGRLPREQTTKLKKQVEDNDSKQQSYHQLLYVFRDIGDGIAFIYLDKWDIKPLCLSKEHAGFISGKKGIRLELKIFRYCKSQSIACIFNDITNSLRHGDITIPKYGVPLIIEAKSGRSGRSDERAKRQEERSKNILKYLINDRGEGVYPSQQGKIMHRSALTITEGHHRKRLETLLIKWLGTQKCTTAKIENGLYYSIFVSKESFVRQINKLPKGARWFVIIVNMEKYIAQAYYPFTLSIKTPEALLSFYEGKCQIIVFVDLNFIESKLRDRGFTVNYCEDGAHFLQIDNPETHIRDMKVSRHFIGRLGAEFLSLDWMIEELCGRMTEPPMIVPDEVSLDVGTVTFGAE
jgi:hypothetical protein